MAFGIPIIKSTAEMSTTNSSNKLQVVMFPWFAYGHLTPFLHLANMLAERGHKIFYIMPKKAQQNLAHLNYYPQLIQFYTITVPHVDGLPPGTETANEIPSSLLKHLGTAYDQTRDQLKTILTTLEPDLIFTDFAHWLHSLAREIGIKSLYYATTSTFSLGFLFVPARKIVKDMPLEELMQPPPGFPFSALNLEPFEAAETRNSGKESGLELTLNDRIVSSMQECDAIAARTCREIEGTYCDYLSQQYAKPLLLTGPVLQELPAERLNKQWDDWLSRFDRGSVVYCAFGSELKIDKEQFQELLLGFEMSGHPFFVALRPPQGCDAIEEAFPEAFEERISSKGCVCGGWVPQPSILDHQSVGCFVTHCGFGSVWEALLSDCQIVTVPIVGDEKMNARLMVDELKVAVAVERRKEDGFIHKGSLSRAIKLVMDKVSEAAQVTRSNHARWREKLSSKELQTNYIGGFIQGLQDILD